MKKQIVIGLLLSGLLVVQSGTSKAEVMAPVKPADATVALDKVKVDKTKVDTAQEAAQDPKAGAKADASSFMSGVKASFKNFFDKTKYESTSISIGIPLPKKVTEMVDKSPDLIKNLLLKLNNDKPLTSLVFDYDFVYGGAGADQVGEYAMSKGFAHIDAKGGAVKIVNALLSIPGFPDEVAKPIKNMLGIKGSTVCLIKMIFLAKKDFKDPKTGKTDNEARFAFISKELPLLLTRLAFTQDFHGPADWIETFLKPLGLEPLVNSIMLEVDASTYFEWKKAQVSRGHSAFYKELSAALDTDDLMARQKGLNELLNKWNTSNTLKTVDYFDRVALMEVITSMVEDLADASRGGTLKPSVAALFTKAVLVEDPKEEKAADKDATKPADTKTAKAAVKAAVKEEPIEGKVGLIQLLNTAIVAAAKAGNFGQVAAGNGKEPMQADLVAVLKKQLKTVELIAKGEKLPATPTLPSKVVERVSINMGDYLRVQYDMFMNNYWNCTFDGDADYVKPLPAKKGLVSVGKDLVAVGVRMLQRYGDALIAYKQTEEGKKAQAAVDEAQAGVKAATATAVALLAKDPKQANDATKKAVAAVKEAKSKVSAARKGQFKAVLAVPVDCFYQWEKDAATGVMVRTTIKGKTDTLRNFLGREVLRAFMALKQWEFIKSRLELVLGVFDLTLKDLGITPEDMKSAAAKEEEKKAKELESQGAAALDDALAALEEGPTEEAVIEESAETAAAGAGDEGAATSEDAAGTEEVVADEA